MVGEVLPTAEPPMNTCNNFPFEKYNYTPDLEQALINLMNAKDSRGLYINLGSSPSQLRSQICQLSEGFSDSAVHFYAGGELNTLDNLILLCNALREHIKAGNLK